MAHAKPKRSERSAPKPAISDAAVLKATGKTWPQWLALLDKAGAKTMPHKGIAALLREKHAVPPWWGQMVAVGYEQARGLREKHQTPDGFQVGATKTIAVALPALYAAFADAKARARWLDGDGDGLTVRKATPDKSLRITWPDGHTWVDVNLYSKGATKSQASVGHTRIPDRARADRLKSFWAEALGRLKEMLEA